MSRVVTPHGRGLVRHVSVHPGHDCVRNPCGERGCGRVAGAGHGIASDTWYYSLTDGDVSLTLSVTSNVFPDSVPKDVVDRWNKVSAGLLTACASFPTDREDVRKAHTGSGCDYSRTGRCFRKEPWGLLANETFEECGGQPNLEQPETFWRGFEGYWERLAKPLYEERVDNYERCPHCDGLGTVRLAECDRPEGRRK